MRKIQEIIIVEGRYDKNTVAQAVDATIIETSGFGIFTDKEKLALLRKLAAKRGLIILTDSDKAGFFIRGRLRGMIENTAAGQLNIKHAYIPDINGRERRKTAASAEGKLGVEGMTRDVILTALEHAGATFLDSTAHTPVSDIITKTDMYELGLTGGDGSLSKRRELLKRLELPGRLTANALLEVLNIMFSRDDFYEYMDSDSNE